MWLIKPAKDKKLEYYFYIWKVMRYCGPYKTLDECKRAKAHFYDEEYPSKQD
jgi:hypothetical protein